MMTRMKSSKAARSSWLQPARTWRTVALSWFICASCTVIALPRSLIVHPRLTLRGGPPGRRRGLPRVGIGQVLDDGLDLFLAALLEAIDVNLGAQLLAVLR